MTDATSWPSFQPHPDDESYCYICGQSLANHGTDETHCPPAVLRPKPPKSAVAKHYDETIARIRTIAMGLREQVAGLDISEDDPDSQKEALAIMRGGAELLDLADELAQVVQAYPHPGIAEQAYAFVTEEVVRLLYTERDDMKTDADRRFLLLYALVNQVEKAKSSNLIGSALTAFAGAALAEGMGAAGRKAARETLRKEAGTDVPDEEKH